MDSYPGVPVLHACGESDCNNCILHLHVPPTSVIVCGLRSQLDLMVFLWVLRFSSLSKKINSQSNIRPTIWCCAPGSCMTVWQQPEVPFIYILPVPSELCPSQFYSLGLQVRMISRH